MLFIPSNQITKGQDSINVLNEKLLKYFQLLYQKCKKSLPHGESIIDGPPFPSGAAHLGTAYNKIIKSAVWCMNAISGQFSEYITGWDCHGLPIENQVIKLLGIHAVDKINRQRFNYICKSLAAYWIRQHRGVFKRGGIFNIQQQFFRTDSEQYSSMVFKSLQENLKAGLIYRDKKEVYWCPKYKTVTAIMDLEEKSTKVETYTFGCLVDEYKGSRVYIICWTTTMWNVHENAAIAYNPEAEYIQYWSEEYNCWLVQSASSYHGPALCIPWHPNKHSQALVIGQDSPSPLIPESFVAPDLGTGFVHISPAYSKVDYEVYLRRPTLKFLSGLLEDPRPLNKIVNDNIELLKSQKIPLFINTELRNIHTSMRGGSEVVLVFMDQIFYRISKDKILQSYSVLMQKNERLYNDICNRDGDWCLSRQRRYGAPIPFYYNHKSHELKTASCLGLEKQVNYIIKTGNTALWWKLPKQIGEFYRCADTLDCWYESALVSRFINPKKPGIFIEGIDQTRGWFQHTLILAADVNEYPISKIIMHGFINDKEGQKMSKTLGNITEPEAFIERYGVDAMRTLFLETGIGPDINFSHDKAEHALKMCNRTRNTISYIISASKAEKPRNLNRLSRGVLFELAEMYNKAMNLCKVHDLSNLSRLLQEQLLYFSSSYIQLLKHDLYTRDEKRGNIQYVMNQYAKYFIKFYTPLIPFTAFECAALIHLELFDILTWEPSSEFSVEDHDIWQNTLQYVDQINKLIVAHPSQDKSIIYWELHKNMPMVHIGIIINFLYSSKAPYKHKWVR
jgi:isoleucyl-tRNA synthetase